MHVCLETPSKRNSKYCSKNNHRHGVQFARTPARRRLIFLFHHARRAWSKLHHVGYRSAWRADKRETTAQIVRRIPLLAHRQVFPDHFSFGYVKFPTKLLLTNFYKATKFSTVALVREEDREETEADVRIQMRAHIAWLLQPRGPEPPSQARPAWRRPPTTAPLESCAVGWSRRLGRWGGEPGVMSVSPARMSTCMRRRTRRPPAAVSVTHRLTSTLAYN
jgi:hypothetical protein